MAVVRIAVIDAKRVDTSLSPEELSKLEEEKAALIQSDGSLKVSLEALWRCPICGSASHQPPPPPPPLAGTGKPSLLGHAVGCSSLSSPLSTPLSNTPL